MIVAVQATARQHRLTHAGVVRSARMLLEGERLVSGVEQTAS